ncbi:NADPH oxidase 4-like [Chrysoperla carnea]|uniref:NADPH oxidase 4-like n=1 Tax=Chrysoperla carnea TaxID=189513 RepID=UPI001D05C6A0|nr:NADPH oxidase 4-like [Chrysoperla carnea]
MCRSINTLTHTTLSLISKKILIVYLSKIKSFHITFATTILIASVIHTLGHIVNACNFSKYYDELYEDINWAEYKNQNPMVLVFKTIPGSTGVLMCIILILLTMTSLRCFRQFHYNVFWYTHNLSIIFLLLLFLHPLSGVIKQQINLTEHIPGCLPYGTIFVNTSTTVVLCKEKPKFQNVKSKGWIWIIIPVIIYWMELCFRFYNRYKYDPKILRMYRLPGQTIYLTLLFRGNYSNFRPGQFILLKCDQLSKLEWHPFSIISCEHSSQNNNNQMVIGHHIYIN